LLRELGIAADILAKTIHTPLSTNQRDALLCLVADEFGGYCKSPESFFESSRLVEEIHAQHYQLAATQFLAFSYIGNRLSALLYKKRNIEKQLFLTGRLFPLDKSIVQ
jgi:GH24 family phage-related lysozyme (muramidase)